MNTVHSLQDLLDRKNGAPCSLCGHIHRPQILCAREALASKIVKLMEANSLIPGLLQHNKEATTLAEGFRQLLKRADEAHVLLMDILTGHGDVGEDIKVEYMRALEKWASKGHISQDTQEEQLHLFNQSPSTLQETEARNSINPPSGLVSEDGSSL